MEYNKLFAYIESISDAYREPVNLLDGLTFDHYDTLRRIEFYSNNQYMSGNKDALGREKPFYNVNTYRVTVAKTATDLDVKDIKFEPDSLKYSVEAMLYNRELFKYLKESNFSKTLNEMGKTRPKYGGLLVKKYEEKGKLDIGVMEWKNVIVDPVNIMGGSIIETHYMTPSEFSAKTDVWENVEEVLTAHAKANKNKPCRIEVKEITGDFPKGFNPKQETGEEVNGYEEKCYYIACVNKKKFYLYEENEKRKDKYKYLAWEEVPGRDLGRGVVEEGFESQVWVNDAMITAKNAMDVATKVVGITTSQDFGGSNAITGVDHGHIFKIGQNDQLSFDTLSKTPLPEVERMIDLWNVQYDRVASTFNANTGEQTPSGTPYAQTALLNQVANSPFEYQREVWGIFLNEILNDWVKPFLKKKISKKHYLVTEFDDEELAVIDDAIGEFEAKKSLKKALLEGKPMSLKEYVTVKESIKEGIAKLGAKREIDIPEGFLNVEGNITANITGELKNKAAILQSLDGVLKTIVSTFNPNTGTYAALEDPTLSKLFGQIIEISGVPFSYAQMKSKPVQGADLSAISNQVAPAQVAQPTA